MKTTMKKINRILSSTLILLSLASCSDRINITNTTTDNIARISSVSSVDSVETLDRLNKSIDAVITEKNTLNNNNLKLFVDGTEAYPALEAMLLSAKKSIYFEVFQYANDASGKKIADILVKKAKEGVKVHFLYDFIGNTNVSLYNYMAKNGVNVETYGKNQLNNKSRITHRKVYIVDGEIAMTGGMNIGNQFAAIIPDYYHDVLVQYQGEAVNETVKEFIYDWKLAGGKVSTEMTADINKTPIFNSSEKTYPIRVVVTSPVETKTDLKKMIFSVIDNAKDNIDIAMPYFTEDNLINHLIAAQQRGVKVRALIPFKTKIVPVALVNDMTANQLIAAGVDVYRGGVTDGTFNHSKIMTVDNSWTTIGSCNADYRALNNNQELNVAISDPEFTQEVKTRFFDKFIHQADKGVTKKIPWYKKPLYDLLEGIDTLL